MTSTNKKYDFIIVGAGPIGCVIAEQLASKKGWSSLLIEKRDHIAGNCYDSFHESGVQIHNYGPHYFRTNSEKVVHYLSRFTEWIDGNYIVKSQFKNELYPFPINLDTLEKFFNLKGLTAETATQLLNEKRIIIEEPKNSEEFVLSRVGQELFDAFYKNYTRKQWDKEASELDKSVCGRIPIKLNRDPYYVNHKFRQTPKKGFTEMFNKMIANPLIDVTLETDYFDKKDELTPTKGTVYTGPIDKYYNYKFGKLEWRSLEFIFEEYPTEFHQECSQINYPNEHDYTRTVEIKHVTKQKTSNTVICKEYPTWNGEPYYPVPNDENKERYAKYKQLSDKETDVWMAGRLAEYTYINSDEAVEKALLLAQKLIEMS